MSQRRDFVEAFARGHWRMTELCARFGIGRKTGYKWWARFRTEGAEFAERPRRPHTSPTRFEGEQAALFLRTRQAQPTWAYLARHHPQQTTWPAASTVRVLLIRAGLVRPRRRRHIYHRVPRGPGG